MKFVNLTPHAIVMNDGRVFESENVARVNAAFSEFSEEGICSQEYGEITGLPEQQERTAYIVSAIVLTAAKAAGRTDCVAPASGHPDTIRNEKGHIVSVPGFVR